MSDKIKSYKKSFLNFGIVEHRDDASIPYCLLCHKKFANSFYRESKISAHFQIKHFIHKGKDAEFFSNLKKSYEKTKPLDLPKKLKKENEPEFYKKMSLKTAFITAKHGKPHLFSSNLLTPILSDFLGFFKINETSFNRHFSISSTSVQRNIDILSSRIESSLVSILKRTVFSLQIDESCFDKKNILIGCVRYFDDKMFTLRESFLFSISLTGGSTGKEIFDSVENYLNKQEIPLENIRTISTDGAPAMVGKEKGFKKILLDKNKKINHYHCVLHRNQLCLNNSSIKILETINTCSSIVNIIKRSPLKSRKFADICDINNEEYNLLFHFTKIRWLSAGNFIKRIFNLRYSVSEFLVNNSEREMDINFKKAFIYMAYTSEVYESFNETTLTLQKNNILIFEVTSIIKAQIEKIKLFLKIIKDEKLWRKSLLLQNTYSYLKDLKEEEKKHTIGIFEEHLTTIKKNTEERLSEIINFKTPDFILDPFLEELSDVPFDIAEEFIKLKCDPLVELSYKNKDILGFWTDKYIFNKYRNVFKKVEEYLIILVTSNRVESAFSHLKYLFSKDRNRLILEVRGDLRIKLYDGKFEDIDFISSN